jgi:hypothetical protein
MLVLGKMSLFTVIYFEGLFLMTMTIGFGYKFIAALIGIAIIVWLYIEIKNYTSG